MSSKITTVFEAGCIEGFPFSEKRRMENIQTLSSPTYVSKFSISRIEKIREALARCGIINEHAVQELIKIFEDS
jgi:hypothetical protein